MASERKVIARIKLQLRGGQANPSPPVGPALGQHGVNISAFCKEFNYRTRDQTGTIIPVVITIYPDRTFSFTIKTPPASFLLKQAARITRGSGEPNRNIVGQVRKRDIEEIARIKMEDLNTDNFEAACRTIMGTARSMGIRVVD